MTGTAILKKTETTRVPFVASRGGERINLGEAGRVVKVKLVSGATVVPLTLGSGVGLSNPGNGEGWFECSAANIATLGYKENRMSFGAVVRSVIRGFQPRADHDTICLMGQELGLVEYLAIIAGSITGIMRDPLSWAVAVACLAAGMLLRGWWWPFAAASLWVGVVVARLSAYWSSLGEDPLRLALWQWFLWLIIAAIAGGIGRLMRRVKKPMVN